MFDSTCTFLESSSTPYYKIISLKKGNAGAHKEALNPTEFQVSLPASCLMLHSGLCLINQTLQLECHQQYQIDWVPH